MIRPLKQLAQEATTVNEEVFVQMMAIAPKPKVQGPRHQKPHLLSLDDKVVPDLDGKDDPSPMLVKRVESF